MQPDNLPEPGPILRLGQLNPAGAPVNIITQARASLQHACAALAIETPARWTGMDRLIKVLDTSGQSLEKHMHTVKGRAINQNALAHIIGIERWAQRRLCVVLGEALCEDSFATSYPGAQSWTQLVEIFHLTRKETVSLGKSLRMAGIDPEIRIPHHQFGNLSILGWLYYINLQANLISVRIQ